MDSGSQITTVTEEFYNTLSPRPRLFSLKEIGLDLNIQGAGGHDIPYIGCILAQVKVPFLPDTEIEVGALVVPLTDYGQHVTVIIGTNVIGRCKNKCKEDTTVPDNWKDAFVACQTESAGVVKSTNKVTIRLKPNESIILSGMVKNCRQIVSAVTETTKGASSRIGVCPRFVKLDKIGKNQRVPVKIYNVSAKEIEITPKTALCELHEVKVLRHLDLDTPGENVQSCQQTVQESTLPEDKELPAGIDLTDSAVTEEQRQELTQFLIRWKGIFSKGLTDLGNCEKVKHRINLNDDKPFKDPHRRIPPALFQEVREHLQEMLDAGAIRPSKSPYSSNVVIVRKKDGTIRFCVDFRKLNNRTVKDAYAIPRTEETLHLLAGAKYFTKLDLRSGYWQVEIEEEDKPKTAFQVGTLGFYEFHRMPFGLCNAPATFQRLMDLCMGDINLRECLVYLDDVIIFSTTFEEHIDRLQAVFTRPQDYNLKLKATKCEFMKSEVTYLGHIVSRDGIRTDPEKTAAIENWPEPKTVKDVRAFLGFTGYYRRFIKNYAMIARPLNDLLVGHSTAKNNRASKRPRAKKTPFVWTDAQQMAFKTLKEKLTNPPVLAYADYRLPFKLYTDASTTGLGAVLYQQRFFWPYMNKFIRERVQSCGRCIRRKTAPVKAAHLVNITSSAPMELVCIDYLSLERSKGGFENILVITDHFSRYAQAIPTRNQTAQTTARALFENFFLHYGFPAKLHSDKGANFESKVIKKLCEVAGIQKTRTTPYHPMGNGMVERFNHTLLNMLGTMSEKQKTDWKAHVPSFTHAYNAAVHESTGFSPFYLMFGRYPRLAIDAFLGIRSSEERKSHQDYVDKLKDRMADAYQNASEEARQKGRKYKRYYDHGVRYSVLEPGDRVLVKKVGIKGKHKLADIWEAIPYLVKSQPMPDIPVYLVQKENSTNKPRTLHRNMLLPFNALPCPEEEPNPRPRRLQQPLPTVDQPAHGHDDSDEHSSSSNSSDEEDDNSSTLSLQPVPKYVIPQRRSQQENTDLYSSRPTRKTRPPAGPRRGQRTRRQPDRLRFDQWRMGANPYTFTVRPEDVIFI